jgi:hypothetical protein
MLPVYRVPRLNCWTLRDCCRGRHTGRVFGCARASSRMNRNSAESRSVQPLCKGFVVMARSHGKPGKKCKWARPCDDVAPYTLVRRACLDRSPVATLYKATVPGERFTLRLKHSSPNVAVHAEQAGASPLAKVGVERLVMSLSGIADNCPLRRWRATHLVSLRPALPVVHGQRPCR